MFSIEEDYHGWLLDQAAALRSRNYEAVDWEQLAEEIEGMAVSERREIKNRLTTLLMHLLKLQFQPHQVRRHNSWRSSVIEARRQILNILEVSPGVFQGRDKRDEILARTYNDACKDAAHDSQLPVSTFPEVCPWTYEQVMDEDLFPGVSEAKGEILHPSRRKIDLDDLDEDE